MKPSSMRTLLRPMLDAPGPVSSRLPSPGNNRPVSAARGVLLQYTYNHIPSTSRTKSTQSYYIFMVTHERRLLCMPLFCDRVGVYCMINSNRVVQAWVQAAINEWACSWERSVSPSAMLGGACRDTLLSREQRASRCESNRAQIVRAVHVVKCMQAASRTQRLRYQTGSLSGSGGVSCHGSSFVRRAGHVGFFSAAAARFESR